MKRTPAMTRVLQVGVNVIVRHQGGIFLFQQAFNAGLEFSSLVTTRLNRHFGPGFRHG
jgi:hypothetical protein